MSGPLAGSPVSLFVSTMPRAQNRTAKGSILKEEETLCPSGSLTFVWEYVNKVMGAV